MRIVDTGREIKAKITGGVGLEPAVLYMAIGSGSAAESDEDTALGSEITATGMARGTAEISTLGNTTTWHRKFANESGSAMVVREVGLMNASAADGTDLYGRHVYIDEIAVPAGVSLSVTVNEVHSL